MIRETFSTWTFFILSLCTILVISVAQDVDLAVSLTASGKGFRIKGAAAEDISGYSVSAAGDVNGDGIGDVIVSSIWADSPTLDKAGIVYVIFGRDIAGGAAPFVDVQLTTWSAPLPSDVGFRILGAGAVDMIGSTVSAAGDVNGDGIDDVIVGAHQANLPSKAEAGISYVIFGRNITDRSVGFGDVQLTTTALSASVGFRVLGAAAHDCSGRSVDAAGDVNNDGIDDIIIGAFGADPPAGGTDAGISYVIFGRNVSGGANAFGDIQLTTGVTALLPSIGFRILGAAVQDYSGYCVSGAGDVNGDSVDDVIIGAYAGNSLGGENAGISYVIFGRKVGGAVPAFGDIQLPAGVMTATVGFRILGANAHDASGYSVSAAGDVNNDGVGDIIIGAQQSDPPAGSQAGIAYVIFGRDILGGEAPFGDVQLVSGAAVMSPSVGFRILGAAVDDFCGVSVSAAGDVNGDRIDDVIMGAHHADPLNRISAGASYVIYGRNIPGGAAAFGDIQLSPTAALLPSIGFRILGADPNDISGLVVNAAGDVNGDGIGDVIVGAHRADVSSVTDAGISYVVFGVNLQPTSQPSSQPSRQPSNQPLGRPTSVPSSQPSGAPTSQPSRQPTTQPLVRPSAQPSAQPSRFPTTQPSAQPSRSPTSQPSFQPSIQPSSQPSNRPSQQPSSQPTIKPSPQPSSQPSSRPSAQPSLQPSDRPSAQPTTQPSSRPSSQPSRQPASEPSAQPSSQPLSRPSAQPTTQPSIRPSAQPSQQPASEPSAQPSSQPSIRPSAQPSSQPLSRPSAQPSLQPSIRPSAQPSSQPLSRPSAQPSSQPSIRPSAQPSTQPSNKPSVQPSSQPSAIPSTHPSSQPSSKPSAQPSTQPSRRPSVQPSIQPSSRPSAQLTSEPSVQPTHRPSSQPTSEPTVQSSNLPTTQLSAQPVLQPSAQPSGQPSCIPTVSAPTVAEEWITNLQHFSNITSGPILLDTSVWTCGANKQMRAEIHCDVLDAASGILLIRHLFQWTNTAFILQRDDISSIVINGETVRSGTYEAELAVCAVNATQLSCTAKSFADTQLVAGSYASAVSKMIYIGQYNAQALAMVVQDVAGATVRSYMYSSTIMKTITFSHIHSPPNYVGSFIAGTCVNSGSVRFIFAAMMRADSGGLTAMYIAPTSGRIVNSAELVNAMALEYENPDSFIAGGLQLNGDNYMHAYLLCVNSIHRKIIYGVRYVLRGVTTHNNRRLQLTQNIQDTVISAMVRVENVLYLVLHYQEQLGFGSVGSLSVLKTDIATGSILQQVQIYSTYESIQCTDIAASGLSLALACTVTNTHNTTQALVLLVKTDLTFSQLPREFVRYANTTFVAKPVAFQRTFLPLSVTSFDRNPAEYTLNPIEGHATRAPSVAPAKRPSTQPSSVPSGQPSSSPTAAPSVSPQPTSHPSSSGPTNTYKPTVKPTQRPTTAPSIHPTQQPSRSPTVTLTARPTVKPSVHPSAQPSVAPTVKPTHSPTATPTRLPSAQPSTKPTAAPSVEATVLAGENTASSSNSHPAYAIFGYAIAGVLGLWLLWFLRRWCRHKLGDVQSDANRALYVESMGSQPIPRFPIFTFVVSLFVTIKAEEVDFVSTEAKPTTPAEPPMPARTANNRSYNDVGANLEGPAGFNDLEANIVNNKSVSQSNNPVKNLLPTAREADNGNQSDVSKESSITSGSFFSELGENSDITESAPSFSYPNSEYSSDHASKPLSGDISHDAERSDIGSDDHSDGMSGGSDDSPVASNVEFEAEDYVYSNGTSAVGSNYDLNNYDDDEYGDNSDNASQHL